MNECPCGQMTKNPKFCSKSCAAKHNNRLYPKRTAKKHLCADCGIEISKGGYQRCRPCMIKHNIDQFGSKRLSDFTSTAARHRHQNVRAHAHRVAKQAGMDRECAICGYSNHVELAHRKPIHEFSLDTTLREINALDNIVFLCPNHHWEMENIGRAGLESAASTL